MFFMYLVRSSYLDIQSFNGSYLIYNTLLGNPIITDEMAYDFLSTFNHPISASIFMQGMGNPVSQLVNQLVKDHILVEQGTDERDLLAKEKRVYLSDLERGRSLSVLTLLVSGKCNFACKYCYQERIPNLQFAMSNKRIYELSSNASTEKATRGLSLMSFETAQRALVMFAASARNKRHKVLRIIFNGGEALLNWPLVESVLHYASDKLCNEFLIEWWLNTNASLVTPSIAKILRKFDVRVSTSLDGNKVANDKVRVASTGRGTYDLILKGIRTLVEENAKIVGVYITISKDNIDGINEEFIDAIKDIGIRSISLEPDITQPYSISVDELVEKILTLKRIGAQKGIHVGGSWAHPFRELMSSNTHSGSGHYCYGVSGEGAIVAPMGEILTCGGIPTDSRTIWQSDAFLHADADLASLVSSRYVGSIPFCRGCEIEGLCKGGCFLVNSAAAASDNDELHYQRCTLLRTITRRLVAEFSGE